MEDAQTPTYASLQMIYSFYCLAAERTSCHSTHTLQVLQD